MSVRFRSHHSTAASGHRSTLSADRRGTIGRALILLSGCALALLITGCGQPAGARVAGRVTVSGQGLADGVISFRPAPGNSGPEFSATIHEGLYSVAQPVAPGSYAVEIRAWRNTGRTIKGQFGKQIEERIEAISPRYWGANTELSASLQAGDNSKDFELEPSAGRVSAVQPAPADSDTISAAESRAAGNGSAHNGAAPARWPV